MDEDEDEGGVLELAGAALRIVGMKADKVRKDFDFWIHTSIWGMGWDVLNCICPWCRYSRTSFRLLTPNTSWTQIPAPVQW